MLKSASGRFCSLIPGLGVKLSTTILVGLTALNSRIDEYVTSFATAARLVAGLASCADTGSIGVIATGRGRLHTVAWLCRHLRQSNRGSARGTGPDNFMSLPRLAVEGLGRVC